MAEELGKIEKPEAEQFKEKRKLYLVPLLFSWEDAPAEYVERFNLYWQQVSEHIANLESKIGKVNRVYHESITMAGEDGLKVLEKLNSAGCQIVRDKCQSGAEFEAAEDTELAEESMDWERHLLMGFISEKVARMVSDFFLEALDFGVVFLVIGPISIAGTRPMPEPYRLSGGFRPTKPLLPGFYPKPFAIHERWA